MNQTTHPSDTVCPSCGAVYTKNGSMAIPENGGPEHCDTCRAFEAKFPDKLTKIEPEQIANWFMTATAHDLAHFGDKILRPRGMTIILAASNQSFTVEMGAPNPFPSESEFVTLDPEQETQEQEE